jgi:hypothetical protein
MIDEHNQLLHALHSSADRPFSIVIAMHDVLSRLNKHVKDKVLTAKVCWVAHLCSKIHDMAIDSCLGAHSSPHEWQHRSSREVSHNGYENA